MGGASSGSGASARCACSIRNALKTSLLMLIVRVCSPSAERNTMETLDPPSSIASPLVVATVVSISTLQENASKSSESLKTSFLALALWSMKIAPQAVSRRTAISLVLARKLPNLLCFVPHHL